MRPRKIGLLLVLAPLFLLLCLSGYASETGYLRPSEDFGDFTDPENAYRNDGNFASVRGGNVHRYWGYDITIPSGSSIDGIEVIIEGRETSRWFSVAEIAVELSWNGGTSWTSTGNLARFNAPSENRYVVGGSDDDWGRNWSVSELSGSNFRIKLTDETFPWWPVRIGGLDWVSVKVHYSGGATVVAPRDVSLVVDRGKVTEAGPLDMSYSGNFSGPGQITVSAVVGFGNAVPGTVLKIKGGDLTSYSALIAGSDPEGSQILKSNVSGSGMIDDVFLQLDASEVQPGASYLGSSWEYVLTYTLSGP